MDNKEKLINKKYYVNDNMESISENNEKNKNSIMGNIWKKLNKMEKFNVVLFIFLILYIVFTYTPAFEYITIYKDVGDIFYNSDSTYAYKDRLYYTKYGSLYSCNLDGKNRKIETTICTATTEIIYAYDDKIFLSSNESNFFSTHCYNLKNKRCVQIHDERVSEKESIEKIRVIDNKLYFTDDDDYTIEYDFKENKTKVHKFGNMGADIFVTKKGEVGTYYYKNVRFESNNIEIPGETVYAVKEYKDKLHVFTNDRVRVFDKDKKEISSTYSMCKATESRIDDKIYCYDSKTEVLYYYDMKINGYKPITDKIKIDEIREIGYINDQLFILAQNFSQNDKVLIYEGNMKRDEISIDLDKIFLDKENECFYYYDRLENEIVKYEF